MGDVDARVTLPNVLSASRLVAAPALVVSAALGATTAFLAIVATALISDAIDGPIARARGQASLFGARLDSAADCALYLSAPAALLLLYPNLRALEGITIGLIFLGYAVPIVAGLVKFRRLTSYHTRLARIAGVLLSAGGFYWAAVESGWLLRLATAVHLVSAVEELSITWLLREWKTDVPSAWAAWLTRGGISETRWGSPRTGTTDRG